MPASVRKRLLSIFSARILDSSVERGIPSRAAAPEGPRASLIDELRSRDTRQRARVDDFDRALQTARSLITRLEEEPHVNPNTQTKEFSLRDPDGYYVTISALSAA